MWFDGKFVSEIRPEEICQLVANKTAEDVGIDFKIEPYGGPASSEDKKQELCEDVASFANANLGYIVIGIRDRDDRAIGWAPVSDPESHVERIRMTCLDGIEPRLTDLEVGSIEIVDKGYVIVIRVPEGGQKPYMVTRGRQTFFPRRYGDGKREMSYSEIRDAFRSDWSDLRLSQIDAKIDLLVHITREHPPVEIIPGADALTARTPEQLNGIMEARLREIAEE